MKKLIFLFTVVFVIQLDISAQYVSKFDSVKVYTSSFYGTGPHLNKYDIMYSGDSVLITDSQIINQFYEKLIGMKKLTRVNKLKKLRQDFTSISMNVRAVFVFYNGQNKIIIGVSPQSLIFFDHLVFETNDNKLEDIVKSSNQIYKNLFPTREEILRGNN
jgi:hypothetical protein